MTKQFLSKYGAKIAALLLMLIVCAAVLPVNIRAAAATSGTCGDNLSWKLTDNVLTISGSGDMKNFSSSSGAPWYDSRTKIKEIEIGSGVTSIGKNAFYNCTGISEVVLPKSVVSVGAYAFQNCNRLEEVTMAGAVTLGSASFRDCPKLKT